MLLSVTCQFLGVLFLLVINWAVIVSRLEGSCILVIQGSFGGPCTAASSVLGMILLKCGMVAKGQP